MLTAGTDHTCIREEGVPLICLGPIDSDLPALTQLLLLCCSQDWLMDGSSPRREELSTGLEEVHRGDVVVDRGSVVVDQVDDDRLWIVVDCFCPGHSDPMIIAESIVASETCLGSQLCRMICRWSLFALLTTSASLDGLAIGNEVTGPLTYHSLSNCRFMCILITS